MTTEKIALAYLNAGLSVIPVRTDGSKSPPLKWKAFQIEPITPVDAGRYWGMSPEPGIAVVCGAVSGGVEVIDFDERELFASFDAMVRLAGMGGVLDTLTLVETPNGMHMYMRLMPGERVPGNSKLAERLIPTADGASLRRHTLIETRGEGGYVLAPGCPPACHPDGKEYILRQGSLLQMQIVSRSNWQALRAIASSLTEILPEEVESAKPVGHSPPLSDGGLRPGDDFAARGGWESVLEKHGWARIGARGGTVNWRRPGKSHGLSATSNYGGSGLFYVFSSNAHPFKPLQSYTPFAVYTILEHGGVYDAAAKKLGADGYGSPPKLRGISLKRPGSGIPHRERSPGEPLTAEQDNAGAELIEGGEDFDIALLWAELNAQKYAYLEGDQWWKCDGRIWQYSSAESATASVQRLLLDMKLAGSTVKITPARVRGVQFLAKSQLGPLPATIFDGRADWIPLRNGVYDILSKTLLPHSPLNKISRITDFDFAPDAVCPRWQQFLSEVLIEEDGSPCQEWIEAMQLWFGYCLVPDTRLQTSMIWIGDGANGKGVATRVLSNLVGMASVTSIPIEQLHDPYHRAGLQGKLIGLVNEPDPKAMTKNGNWFKAIVGGDQPIAARRPTEKVFEFFPLCRVVMSTNEMPRTKDLSNGYFRRIILIEFRRVFSTPDTTLDEQLASELPGIFNWALAGLQRLRDDPHLKIAPEPSKKLMEGYRKAEDNVTRFMEEHYEKGKSDLDRIPGPEIYDAYRKWCETNGEYLIRGDPFGKRLSKMGYSVKVFRVVENGASAVKRCRLPILKIGESPELFDGEGSELPI